MRDDLKQEFLQTNNPCYVELGFKDNLNFFFFNVAEPNGTKSDFV